MRSRSNEATTPARTCCSGRRRRAARSRVTAAISTRSTDAAGFVCGAPVGARSEPRGRWRSRWSSAFCSTSDRKLLSIGYRVADGTLDPNCYDLLASEARLASFVAIAKGDVPARHWFRLGRAVTPVAHGAALISWSGSMFEYLMPSLVMRAPAGSLLEQTSRLVVRRQIDYGAKLGVPWGVSESAYNARDLEFTYQYSNFGVPGLGLKRGLGENVVIAPYATALASHGRSAGRGAQLRRASPRIGARGRYGFYEALDYTPSRVPDGKTRRDRARLHGAPPGHDDRRHRQRAAGRRRCGRAFTPSRSSRRRNCCCRSARRAMSRWRVRWAADAKSAAKIQRHRAARRPAAHHAHTARRPRRTCCRTAAMR